MNFKKIYRKQAFLLGGLFLFLLFPSCDIRKGQDNDSENVRKEMEDRKPKKLSQAAISQEAEKMGKEIVVASQKALQEKLQQAIKTGGLSYAVDFCNLEALSLMDSLSKAWEVEVRRASLRYRNPVDQADSLEALFIDTYAYSLEENLPLRPQVERENENTLLYVSPITISNALCLNCHGKAGEEIPEELLKTLKERYPQDKAQDHSMGDLRGIWSIRIPQKSIVSRL